LKPLPCEAFAATAFPSLTVTSSYSAMTANRFDALIGIQS
jgi:hypothetical protein